MPGVKKNFSLSEEIITKMLLIYFKFLPKKLNRSILTMLEVVLIRMVELLSDFSLQAYIISGKEKHTGMDLNILYCGDLHSFHYLSQRFFDGEYKLKNYSRVSITHINKLLNSSLPEYLDLIIVKADRFFKKYFKPGFLVIPEWVNLILDTSRSLEEIEKKFSNGAKKDIKKIKKYGYTYDLIQNPEKMEYFYDHMFLPFILDRHEEETRDLYLRYIKMILNRKSVKLLLVKDLDKTISGGLVDIRGKYEILPSMGVLDANHEYLKKYAASALFYFHILSAKERGIKTVNYGDTRSFVDDGSYQFKRKWGMEVTRSCFSFKIFGFKFLKNNPPVLSFLENNPFIFEEDDKLKIFLYSNKPDLSIKDVQRFCRSYHAQGIEEIVLISPYGFSEEVIRSNLFEGTSKYNFYKKTGSTSFLGKNVSICIIKESPFLSD